MQVIRLLFGLVVAVCLAYAQQNYINITTIPYLIPESMDYVSGTGYILGSLSYGGAYRVNTVSEAVTVFLQQGVNMNHTSGVQYDTRGGRNRILLCSVVLPPPFGPGGIEGGVISIDLSSGSPVLSAFYDTSAVGPSASFRFCNDMITDDAGTIYATDSFGSQVWKITPAGVVSQLIHDSRWDENNFALDGIEMTRDGNLVVSHISHSELWLVTTAAPITATQITVAGNYANSAPDGIYFGLHGCLYTVGNNKVYRLASSNGWLNATVLEEVTVTCLGPTAITWNADASAYYVSCAHGFDGGPYAIEKITFAAAETDVLCHTDGSSATMSAISSMLLVVTLIATILLFHK